MSEEKQTPEQAAEVEAQEEAVQAETEEVKHDEQSAFQEKIDELQQLLDEKKTKFCVFKQILKTINAVLELKWRPCKNIVLNMLSATFSQLSTTLKERLESIQTMSRRKVC